MRVISRPFNCRQQLRVAGRNQVDQVLLQRLFRGIGVRRLHCCNRRIRIAAAPGHIRTQKRLGIVLDLLHLIVSSGLPPSNTTCAAPASVPGAIAATSAASSRKNPAEPARAPDGATYTITGTRDLKIAPAMRAHRIHQSARRVHLHQQRRRAVGVGLRNGPVQLPALTGWIVSSSTNLVHQRLLRARMQRPAQTEPNRGNQAHRILELESTPC